MDLKLVGDVILMAGIILGFLTFVIVNLKYLPHEPDDKNEER